jgi:chromosome segregation ATPase
MACRAVLHYYSELDADGVTLRLCAGGADGMCPLCLASRVADLERQLAEMRSDRDSLRQDRDAFSENLSAIQRDLAIAVTGEGFYEQFHKAETALAQALGRQVAAEEMVVIQRRANEFIAKELKAAERQLANLRENYRSEMERATAARAALAAERAAREKAEARLAKMMTLHKEWHSIDVEPQCDECGKPWPCPTDTTLVAALSPEVK